MSLIVQDFSGVHNKNEGTSARLIKGGSFKKQRIISIIPAIYDISPKVYLSHCNLAFPPNNGVIRILALGMEVGDAYSEAIKGILDHPELKNWEYILTLEHDNIPAADGILKLLEQMESHPEYHAIGGLYFTKGEGGVAQIWGDPKDPIVNFRPQIPGSNLCICKSYDKTIEQCTLQECCGTGMGFTLFRLSMFKDKQLRSPWFVTQKKDGIATQDLYFWSDARKFGYRCAIDTSVKVGHYDKDNDIVW